MLKIKEIQAIIVLIKESESNELKNLANKILTEAKLNFTPKDAINILQLIQSRLEFLAVEMQGAEAEYRKADYKKFAQEAYFYANFKSNLLVLKILNKNL